MRNIVLFVDDSPGVIGELKSKLRMEGFETVFYSRLDEAYNKIADGLDYDYAVFDSEFPKGRYNIEDLVEISKKINPSKPIMIYSVEPYIDMKGNKGINSFVEKKFGSDKLVQEILRDYFKLRR